MITDKIYNADLVSLPDKKTLYEIAKELCFDEKPLGNKSTRDESPIKILQSCAILASRIFTIFLPENPDELCGRLIFLLQEKHAEHICDLFNEDNNAMSDNLLESKCICTTLDRFLLPKSLN